MKTFHLAALTLALAIPVTLATPAVAQTEGGQAGMKSMTSANPSAPEFATQAAQGDLFEIQSSELALQQSTSAATRAFATQMIEAHRKTTTDLKGMVASDRINVKLPTAMNAAQQQMMTKLQGLQGTAFDTQYRKDQIFAHENAVLLFERYAQAGDNAALKGWAANTLGELQHHLEMARQLPGQ